jgi:hypothetical protein
MENNNDDNNAIKHNLDVAINSVAISSVAMLPSVVIITN